MKLKLDILISSVSGLEVGPVGRKRQYLPPTESKVYQNHIEFSLPRDPVVTKPERANPYQ